MCLYVSICWFDLHLSEETIVCLTFLVFALVITTHWANLSRFVYESFDGNCSIPRLEPETSVKGGGSLIRPVLPR